MSYDQRLADAERERDALAREVRLWRMARVLNSGPWSQNGPLVRELGEALTANIAAGIPAMPAAIRAAAGEVKP